jgi:acetyltransferase-like isoleucine patch superfamily enzyme
MQHCEISPNARIGQNVQVGYGTRIFDSAEIGDNTMVGDHCLVGLPVPASTAKTCIGSESVIRSHAVIYQGAEVGPQFQTGHHTLVRDGIRAGVNLRLGSFSDLEGDTVIGDYCRFHGYVQLARGTRVGSFVWLFSFTILAADPLPPSHFEKATTIEDGVVVCVGCSILPGTILRRGAFVCAGSCARGEVPPGGVVDGHQGEVIAHVTQLRNRQLGIEHPWMSHFADAYPEAAQARIRALHQEIINDVPLYKEARARRKRHPVR